jgi:DNA polymerase
VVAPIEIPVQVQQDLLSQENPQLPLLMAPTWNELITRSKCMACTCCRVGPTNNDAPPVLYRGDPRSEIIFIGEAPGEEERKAGTCFVGKSGEFLSNMVVKAQLMPGGAFFTNILRCRPYDKISDRSGQSLLKDRAPAEDEAHACMPLLRKTLEFARGKILIMVGKWASVYCLGLRTTLKITENVGYGVPLTVAGQPRLALLICHPSYLMRNKGDTLRYQQTLQVLDMVKAHVFQNQPLYYHLLSPEAFSNQNRPMYYSKNQVLPVKAA